MTAETPTPTEAGSGEREVAARGCDVVGCSRPHRAKGLCVTHWARLKRRGTLERTEQWEPGPKRLWARVDKTDSCWLWLGPVNLDGYGFMMVKRQSVKVHRYAWTLLRGSIPDELVLDHICRVRNCVNPDHLEPVTQRANVLRGIGLSAINARKTHCKHGHEFTEANTYRAPSRPNGRRCRECARANDLKQRARKKAA